MKRTGVVLILILAFCGLSDSVYLSQNEANNSPLICNVENLSDCNVVAASQYAHLFGISIADYGVIFYAFIFVISALELAVFDRLLRRVLQVASFIGIFASLYFTFIELFVIRAICIYCIVSACIALLIFIFACLIEPLRKNLQYKPPV
ncbi:MAG: vitamin K epoxide reductase family protein [bacterium]